MAPKKSGYEAGFKLRIDPELKLALTVEAVKNHRSLNAEIVYRLTRSLDSYTR